MTTPRPPSALPSWDLSALYASIDDPALACDTDALLERARRFAQEYRSRINDPGLTAERLLAAVQEYEEIQRLADRPRRYASLVQDRALADTLFERIHTAWQATHDCLLSITGQSRLLEKNPPLDASIRLRLPYIEPLNLLQVELLKRHRAGETDARVREGIQLSINAVATALRNSG